VNPLNRQKGKEEKILKRSLVSAALICLIVVVIVFVPIAEARPFPSIDGKYSKFSRIRALKSKIEAGFMRYLRKFHSKWVWFMSSRIANKLFIRFLRENPEYRAYMKEYASLTRKEAKKLSLAEWKAIKFGKIFKTFDTTINGTEYRVELRKAWLSDGSLGVKVSFCGNGRVIDPWIYVHVEYLRITIWIWTITYGEVDYLYQYFVTNNNGRNEALLVKAQIQEECIGGTFLGAIMAILIAAIPGTGGLSGVLAGILAALTTYQSAWLSHVVETGYDSRRGLYICSVANYMYWGPGSFSMWVWWWADWNWHRAVPAPGLEIFSLNLGYSQLLGSGFRSIGDKYGFDRWVWLS